jgi:hypothetical protein
MRVLQARLGLAFLGMTMAVPFYGQVPAAASVPDASVPGLPAAAPVAADAPAISVPTMAITPAVQLLEEFRPSDVKFSLNDLMDVLRDRRHEGWVLAAYPDPKTGQPLIGAGFSLDLPARPHPQPDPLNPHPFLEPSSAELWQAAGLDGAQLQQILTDYQQRLERTGTKQFRRQIRTLSPQITEAEAILLLRIAAVQAVYNARAYCRNFDQLTASQQMAMSQLVYQMGVNLAQFSQFLGLVNDDSLGGPAPHATAAVNAQYWTTVQQSLIHSQWARLYRVRAISVIAMLDPRYEDNPRMAERRVGATLRPAVSHRRRGRTAASTELASSKAPGTHAGKKTHRAHTKRKAEA